MKEELWELLKDLPGVPVGTQMLESEWHSLHSIPPYNYPDWFRKVVPKPKGPELLELEITNGLFKKPNGPSFLAVDAPCIIIPGKVFVGYKHRGGDFYGNFFYVNFDKQGSSFATHAVYRRV